MSGLRIFPDSVLRMGGRGGLFVSGKRSYINRVLATQAASLIGYWPLNDTSGTTATDKSGNARNGTYEGGFVLGAAGIGDGQTAVTLDGTNGRVDLLQSSAALASAWNGGECTVMAWCKVSDVANWTDGSEDEIFRARVDANNTLILRKSTTNNTLNALYVAGGTSENLSIGSRTDTGWIFIAYTVSKTADQAILYINGYQEGATATGLGTFVGTPTIMVFGAQDGSGSTPWKGTMAHCAIWAKALTAAEVLSLASPF